MKYFAISEDRDTLTGLRLSGIEGAFAANKRDVAELVEKTCANGDVAVLLVTRGCYELCREKLDEIKLSMSRPLVSVIPASGDKPDKTDSITRLIREAIGVKI